MAGPPEAKRCHNGDLASITSTEAESKSRILRELTTYFFLAYGMSLVLWLPVVIGGKVSLAFLSLGTVGPTLAALQFTVLTMAASVFLALGFNCSGGSTLCAIIVHGIYNVATGIILNDMIGKATLYSNTIQHNVFGWHMEEWLP